MDRLIPARVQCRFLAQAVRHTRAPSRGAEMIGELSSQDSTPASVERSVVLRPKACGRGGEGAGNVRF